MFAEFKVVPTQILNCDSDGVYIFHTVAFYSANPHVTSKKVRVQVNLIINEFSYPKMVGQSSIVMARKQRSNIDILKIHARPKTCGSDVCVISSYVILNKAYRSIFKISNQGDSINMNSNRINDRWNYILQLNLCTYVIKE